MIKHTTLEIMGYKMMFYPMQNKISIDWLNESQQKYYDLIFVTQEVIEGKLCVDFTTFLLICSDYFGPTYDSFFKILMFQLYHRKFDPVNE